MWGYPLPKGETRVQVDVLHFGQFATLQKDRKRAMNGTMRIDGLVRCVCLLWAARMYRGRKKKDAQKDTKLCTVDVETFAIICVFQIYAEKVCCLNNFYYAL